jgi:hypothetical protein
VAIDSTREGADLEEPGSAMLSVALGAEDDVLGSGCLTTGWLFAAAGFDTQPHERPS